MRQPRRFPLDRYLNWDQITKDIAASVAIALCIVTLVYLAIHLVVAGVRAL